MITLQIIHAISKTLYLEFKDTFKNSLIIKADQNIQSITTPTFLIQDTGMYIENVNALYFLQRYTFDIHFFPQFENNNLEWSPYECCQKIRNRLFEILEFVQDPETNFIYKGLNMNGVIIDNILHFYITFNRLVHKMYTKNEKIKSSILKIQEKKK